MDIISSEIPGGELPAFAYPDDRDYVRYAKLADLDTVVFLKSNLLRVYPKAKFRDFVSSEHNGGGDGTLFLIGGPSWNTQTRAVQTVLPVKFYEDCSDKDDYLLIESEGYSGDKVLRTEEINGTRSMRDVSVFARITRENGKKTFLFMGALTKGVLGSAKAVLGSSLSVRNACFLVDLVEDNDFVCVFYSHFLGSDVVTTNLEKDRVVIFYSISGTNIWTILE